MIPGIVGINNHEVKNVKNTKKKPTSTLKYDDNAF